MIAAPPPSRVPLTKPAKQNWRWSRAGKGTTIGTTVGIIMDHWGVSPCCTNPPVAKAHHSNDANAPRGTNESYPRPQPSPILGVTIVGPTTAIGTHTYTQHRRTNVPETVATTLTPAVHQGPRHRDGVDMPDAGLHPHREAMHKPHTQSGSSCCAPFGNTR